MLILISENTLPLQIINGWFSSYNEIPNEFSDIVSKCTIGFNTETRAFISQDGLYITPQVTISLRDTEPKRPEVGMEYSVKIQFIILFVVIWPCVSKPGAILLKNAAMPSTLAERS